MGNIWSTTQNIDDDELTSSYDTERDEDEPESYATEASEDDKPNISSNPTQTEPTNTTTTNNTNKTPTANTKYTHKDKDKTQHDNSTPDLKTKIENNNLAVNTKVNNVDNNNNNNTKIQQQPPTPPSQPPPPVVEDWQPTTRRWRSNSARGLKRVDLQNANILVVDDDAVQRTVLRKWLHDEKYKSDILLN